MLFSLPSCIYTIFSTRSEDTKQESDEQKLSSSRISRNSKFEVLGLVNSWELEMHIIQVQWMFLPLCDNPAYPAAASSGRSIGPAQVVSCPDTCRLLPKQWVNSVPQKVELLTDSSKFSAILCQTLQLFTSSFCSLLQTPVKRNLNMRTKLRQSFLRYRPKNMHNRI